MSKNVEQLIVLSKSVELCRTAAQTIGAMAKGREYTKAEQQWIAETQDRLAQRREKKPPTKAGQLRALWPEIRAAIAEGQSLATIRQWLEEEAGIIVTCPEPRPLCYPHSAERTSDSRRTDSAGRSRDSRTSSFAMFHQLLYCQP